MPGLDEAARRAGGYRWAEGRLFEILGGWVASTPEPAVKLMLDRHSQHHAWRAGQWWDRLPVLAGVDRDALVTAPDPAAAAWTDALGALRGTVERLAGAYRVAVPRLAAAYEQGRALLSQVADGSSLRTVDLVVRDLEADWREGEIALQVLLVDGAGVEAASVTASRLETMIVAGQV